MMEVEVGLTGIAALRWIFPENDRRERTPSVFKYRDGSKHVKGHRQNGKGDQMCNCVTDGEYGPERKLTGWEMGGDVEEERLNMFGVNMPDVEQGDVWHRVRPRWRLAKGGRRCDLTGQGRGPGIVRGRVDGGRVSVRGVEDGKCTVKYIAKAYQQALGRESSISIGQIWR